MPEPLSPEPPPLPARLIDPVPAVVVGAALWAVLAATLGVLAALGARPLDEWFWAAVIGVALGGLGLVVLGLQRRAARRGDKGAQQGPGM